MPIKFDLDNAKHSDFINLPPIIAIKAKGKKDVLIYSNTNEDIDSLIQKLVQYAEIEDRFLSHDYWKSMANKCLPKFGTVKIPAKGKFTRSNLNFYAPKYDIRKMFHCPRCQCNEGKQFKCRVVAERLRDFIICGCVTRGDIDEKPQFPDTL